MERDQVARAVESRPSLPLDSRSVSRGGTLGVGTPYIQDAEVTLWHGDALAVLGQLASDSIDAVVTSPPFADARDDVKCVPTTEFAAWLSPILADLLRVTKASLMLNLGRRFRGGEESSYAFETLAAAKSVGWKHVDTIVWSKTNPPGRASGYLTNSHEYVFWLARTASVWRGFDEARAPYSPESLARFQRAPRQAAKGETAGPRRSRPPHPLGAKPWSVFSCPVGKEKGNPHPTPMAPDLAEYLVKLSCPPGGVVLDPFAGSGNTARAARKLGRRAVLIEADEQHVRDAAIWVLGPLFAEAIA